ncbi:MAG TPA: alcohol dehydrogenase catalytic domain-containing protein [Acidothermaceae bacterium]
MLTAAYVGNRTIELQKARALPPARGQVRIHVAFVGVCGTDLHIVHGSMDRRVHVPLIFGHEMSGTIDEVGGGVDGWATGDKVTVMPLVWDDTCPACRAGNRHICQNLNFVGIDSPGALQPLWNLPASTLVRVPQHTGLRDAALVEPVAVAVHDVRRGRVSAGDKIVVVGGGPIGLIIATVARHVGGEVAVVELDPTRRALAAELGFTALHPEDFDDPAWLDEWTGGAGADVVFEVSGAAAGIALALPLAKVRGTIVVVGIHPEPRGVDLQRIFWRELTIVGARVYERTDFEAAVELVSSGVIPTRALITHVVPLAETQAGLKELEGGSAMKVLVDVRAGQPDEDASW